MNIINYEIKPKIILIISPIFIKFNILYKIKIKKFT